MSENRKKIQNLLENVIRASQILIEKGYIEAEDGKEKIRCLVGIRKRFLSDDYMGRSPKGYDIDEIDELILPLDKMLVEAGKKGYQNTISYILKAVIQGAGTGHRILTEEENRNRALVLLQRKLKVRDTVEAAQEAWKLDEKISSRKAAQKQLKALRKDCEAYEKKSEQIRQTRPDIIEEVLYFDDVEDVSSEVLEYIELTSSLEKTKKNIGQHEEDLNNLEYLITSYMQILDDAKRWDISPSAKEIEDAKKKKLSEEAKKANEIAASVPNTGKLLTSEDDTMTSENIFVDDETNQTPDGDAISDEKMLEMQNLIEKFIDEDGPNMVDLGYQAMERAFASAELKAYAAKSLQEFEDLDLSNED